MPEFNGQYWEHTGEDYARIMRELQEDYVNHHYMNRNDDAACLLQEQWEAVHHHPESVACGGCGDAYPVIYLYRCLYCGLWLCSGCASKHFGMSIEDYRVQKRVELRQQLEQARGLDPKARADHFIKNLKNNLR
jgi:hypothetical protein